MTKAHPLNHISPRHTSQREVIPGSTQVPNSAGGAAWKLDCWARLQRFLILGADGPSYYAHAQPLAADNAHALFACISADGVRTVNEIVAISTAGRNPKQHAVIFSLAACAGAPNPATRAAALDALPQVCRTGSHLLLFASFIEQFRGWGRGLRRAVANWYLDRDADALAYQLVKYQSREGWTQRDLLRLAKPRPARGSATDRALAWAVGKADDELAEPTPAILRAHSAAKLAATPAETAALITEHRLPWEAVQSEHLASPTVWQALVPTMGIGALIRNIGRMTANGTLVPGGATTDIVCTRLADAAQLTRARVHPIAVLSALVTYQSGRGARGTLQWSPVPAVVDALDEAFYLSFGNVEPSGARTMLALDVSGSMAWGNIAGVPGLTPRVASAAMAAIALATEPSVETLVFSASASANPLRQVIDRRSWQPAGYTDAVTPIDLSARQRLDDIVRRVDDLPFGGTDCALPMLYALEKGREVDHFVIYTDSETWAGNIHPAQALRQYRERTAINARLTVVGMVSNGFSIADPKDPGMLDVVGFDTAAPQLIADFAAGRL